MEVSNGEGRANRAPYTSCGNDRPSRTTLRAIPTPPTIIDLVDDDRVASRPATGRRATDPQARRHPTDRLAAAIEKATGWLRVGARRRAPLRRRPVRSRHNGSELRPEQRAALAVPDTTKTTVPRQPRQERDRGTHIDDGRSCPSIHTAAKTHARPTDRHDEQRPSPPRSGVARPAFRPRRRRE